DFLESRLREAEDGVVHLLDVFAHAVHFEADVGLVFVDRRRGRQLDRGRRGRRVLSAAATLPGRGIERDGEGGGEHESHEARQTHEFLHEPTMCERATRYSARGELVEPRAVAAGPSTSARRAVVSRVRT